MPTDPLTDQEKRVLQRSLDGTKADVSSQERLLHYSWRIRRHTLKWLGQHEGELFDDLTQMADECANDFEPFPCHTETAKRWLRQLSRRNGLFALVSQEAGIVIWRRSDEGT